MKVICGNYTRECGESIARRGILLEKSRDRVIVSQKQGKCNLIWHEADLASDLRICIRRYHKSQWFGSLNFSLLFCPVCVSIFSTSLQTFTTIITRRTAVIFVPKASNFDQTFPWGNKKLSGNSQSSEKGIQATLNCTRYRQKRQIMPAAFICFIPAGINMIHYAVHLNMHNLSHNWKP